jgi:hypothetical protein
VSDLDRTVECTVGARTFELKPTVRALLTINRRCGSLVEAAQRVQAVDFEVLVEIIAAGADLTKKGREGLQDAAFRQGPVNLVKPCAEFLALLMDPAGDSDDEGDDQGKS